jgi:hypothetical protein
MSSPGQYEQFRNVENQTTSRVLLIVLVILSISCILSALILPEITWVLVICFLYILALEAILLANN